MKKTDKKNVVWQESKVTLEEREAINGHKGVVLWFTGLPASGKTTVARTLERYLTDRKIHAFVLDGDNIRHGLNVDLGFSEEDRRENIRRIGEVAKLFMNSGSIVIVAFISPYRADRLHVREIIKEDRFIEVFVDCPVDVCEKRDPKGHYAKAREGEIKNFTGISAPYEAPEKPEIHLHTDQQDVPGCLQDIISYLKKNFFDKPAQQKISS